jgi:hypothetical protein
MAEIINLRDFRKSKKRGSKSREAAQNRALSGRNKAETARDKDIAVRTKSGLDGKKLGLSEPDTDPPRDSE